MNCPILSKQLTQCPFAETFLQQKWPRNLIAEHPGQWLSVALIENLSIDISDFPRGRQEQNNIEIIILVIK